MISPTTIFRRSAQRYLSLPLLLVFTLLILASTGCNSKPGIVTSIDDLTSDYDYKGFGLRPKQARLAGINGLMPLPTVGEMVHYSPARGSSTLIGLSPEAGQSYRLIQEIPLYKKINKNGTVTYDDVAAINKINAVRDAIVSAQNAALALVTAQLERVRARALAAQEEVAQPTPASISSAANPAPPTTPHTPTTPATPTAESLTTDGAKETDQETPAAATPAVPSTPETRYVQKRADFETKLEAAAKAIDESGLMVFRWATTDQTTVGANAGGLGSIGASGEQQQSGYVIVGGIRQITLLAGTDLLGHADWVGRDAMHWPLNVFNGNKNKRKIITQCIQARHLLYLSQYDLEEAANFKLKASATQLKALGKTLAKLDEIEIKLTIARAQSLSNFGMISGMTRTLEPVRWSHETVPNQTVAQSLQEELKTNNGWQTFHAVGSRFSDIAYVINRRAGDELSESRENMKKW